MTDLYLEKSGRDRFFCCVDIDYWIELPKFSK